MMMNASRLPLVLLVLICIRASYAFIPSKHEHVALCNPSLLSRLPTALYAYVPDGLTPDEYQRIKNRDRKKMGTNLGKLGPRGFESRSMQAWQEAHEKGMADHVFAPVGYREKLAKGEIRKEDIPYMVRGGKWDNSDVRGARRLKWLKTDKEYAKGGYRKEQSFSIFGSGPGLDWTGSQKHDGTYSKKSMPGFS